MDLQKNCTDSSQYFTVTFKGSYSGGQVVYFMAIVPHFPEKTFPPMLAVWRLQTDLFPAAGRKTTCRSLGSSHICSFSSAQFRRAAFI